ncbi:MAG TPA: hypothetical protein VGD97_00345 [Lacunisphaera sp.]
MRRRISIVALCLAWLCANGAIWNAVQVVAWAKMFHGYSRVMPVAQALKLTFNGEAPCDLCHIAETGKEAAREQLPREEALGATDKFVLSFQATAPVVLNAPDFAWPGLVHEAGRLRTESVPVPPPRV